MAVDCASCAGQRHFNQAYYAPLFQAHTYPRVRLSCSRRACRM